MHLKEDAWRLWQFEMSMSNRKHPWNHFNIGSLKVLKEDPESDGICVRDVIHEFFDRHYSANRMKLCVLGREPLPVLKAWAVQCFSRIPNKALNPIVWPDEPVLTKDHIGTQFFIKPVSNTRELILTLSLHLLRRDGVS